MIKRNYKSIFIRILLEFFLMKPISEPTSKAALVDTESSSRFWRPNGLQWIRLSFLRRQTLLAICFFALFSAASAQTQDPCQATLERAEDHYDVGEYGKVIALLQQCPPDQFPEARHQIRAYKVLALALLKLGFGDSAQTAVGKLLDLRPQYAPDPNQDPEDFIALVNKIKREREAKMKGANSKKWLWIGGGAAVAGAVAAFLIFKEEDLQDLPLPPNPPR
jgi:hypothetical protein